MNRTNPRIAMANRLDDRLVHDLLKEGNNRHQVILKLGFKALDLYQGGL
jgi:hypothetical protein